MRAVSATWCVCGRPESGWWRCSVRSTDSEGRPSRGPRLRPRSIPPLGFQSIAFTVRLPPRPTRCSPTSTCCWWISRTRAHGTIPTSPPPWMSCRLRDDAASRWSCSIVPTRSAAQVQGNVLEPAHITPVGRLTVPMRHGLTLGEMARLAREDLGITGRLEVVPVAGWQRSMPFDQHGSAVHPAESEPADAREPLPLSRHLPLRGDEPLGRPRLGCAVRAAGRPMARYGRGLERVPAGRVARGAGPRGHVHTPESRRWQIRGHRARRDPPRGHRPGDLRRHRDGGSPPGRDPPDPSRAIPLDPEAL